MMIEFYFFKFLVYSQIWLNLPRDDPHFGYKREINFKNTWVELRRHAYYVYIMCFSIMYRHVGGGGKRLDLMIHS
jgi:hypothetical protein